MATKLWMDGKDLVVHTTQDAEPIIEDNKRWQGEKQSGEFRKVASIPVTILHQWLQEEWNRGNSQMTLFSDEFNEVVRRKLQDRDWLFLRTA